MLELLDVPRSRKESVCVSVWRYSCPTMSRVGVLVCAETEWGANEYVGQLNVASTEEDDNN